MKKIALLKNNDKRDFTDMQWVTEFHEFLQGNLPDNIKVSKKPRLTSKQAFTVIWYLQEHFPLIPDSIEQCDNCGGLYDSYSEGTHSEKDGKFYCGGCC